MSWRTLLLTLACLQGAWLVGEGRACAADESMGLIELDPPGPREFVRDLAHLLRPADQQKIKQLGDRLLTDKATPILVVTIDSMAQHGGAKMRIDTFALLLFNQWGIGSARLNGEDWNTGILLLVSKGDRKARIELGGYWRRENDLQCHQIMDQTIIPKFKGGDYSGGILAGVEALDTMARALQLPAAAAAANRPVANAAIRPPANMPPVNQPFVEQPRLPPVVYHYAPPPARTSSPVVSILLLAVVIAGVSIVVLLVGSLLFSNTQYRNGGRSYFGNDYFGSGPFFGGQSNFGHHSFGNSGGDFSGGHSAGSSFSGGGGSFGGGSSGGGGATGSW